MPADRAGGGRALLVGQWAPSRTQHATPVGTPSWPSLRGARGKVSQSACSTLPAAPRRRPGGLLGWLALPGGARAVWTSAARC